jgi:hypothetical protein
MSLNEDKLNALLGKFVGDLGATMHAGSIVIGERLGLYKAMATPDERIHRHRTCETYEYEKALRPRMAEHQRRPRLYRIRRRRGRLRYDS